MSPLLSFVTVALPVLVLAGNVVGGPLTWVFPLVVFGLIPILELFLPAPPSPSVEEMAPRWAVTGGDAVIYVLVALTWAIVLALVWRHGTYETWELVGATLSTGICCGAIGINLGHELGHRAGKLDRFLAKVSLSSSLYVHFFIEHNRGHHANVGTPGDPASARRGETVYGFWLRSIVGSYRSAWRLENERLARAGRRTFSLSNEMVRYHLFEAALLVGIFALGGPMGLALFAIAALLGVLLLETVNYIEHYGLEREQLANGKYERIGNAHSWSSDNPVSRVLLFDLTRHADHHAHPGRRWSALRHVDDSPELPTGYPALIMLSLLPPLWFAVMHAQLEKEHARIATR
jgi:alkane 1-monooxygenase